MKKFFLILLSFSLAFGFDIVLNSGADNNQPFWVLHLKDKDYFTCKELIVNGQAHFECAIDGEASIKELQDQSFNAFDLKFAQEDKQIKINILPKIPAKMYNLAQEIYNSQVMQVSPENNSTSFTFIFSNQIPYMKDSDGLNFDITFSNLDAPYIGALDLNSNPVYIPQSADINTFIRIKDEYEKKNYAQVITDASNAIKRYTSSIFMSEFMFYKIRAQNQLYTYTPDFRNQDELEQLVEDIRSWNRRFTSDRNFVESLYILMRAYMALEQKSNVDYTMQILNTEHPGNYFTELASLDYADYIAALGQKDEASAIYEQIYYNTKDLNLAARAGVSLAKDEIVRGQMDAAIAQTQTILRSNPQYFSLDANRAMDLARAYYDKNQFDLSAQIYELAFKAVQSIDENYEQALKNTALAFSKTKDYQKAKQYLDMYANQFPNGEFIPLIQEASDNVFFNLPDNNATFLHQRYAELMKQYGNEIAAKALLYDVRLYFKENNINAVLAYKDEIERYANPELNSMLEKSATQRLIELLRSDDCLAATNLFEEFSSYEIGQKIPDKKQMLACLTRTQNVQEAKNYIDKNRGEDEIYYDLKKAELDLADKSYDEAVRLADGVLNSRTMKSDEERFDAYYFKFLALLRSDKYNEAMAVLSVLEDLGMNYKMVELYHEFLLYCVNHNLRTSILTYAPRAIDYQNLRGVNVYSPELEFIYLQALKDTNQSSTGLEVLTDLLKIKALDDSQRARALYMQSEFYENLNQMSEQNASLTRCLDLNATSNWQDLCRQKAQILQ